MTPAIRFEGQNRERLVLRGVLIDEIVGPDDFLSAPKDGDVPAASTPCRSLMPGW